MTNKRTSLLIHRALTANKSSVTVDGVSYPIKTSRDSRFVKIDKTLFFYAKKQRNKQSFFSSQPVSPVTYMVRPGKVWQEISNRKAPPLQEEQDE